MRYEIKQEPKGVIPTHWVMAAGYNGLLCTWLFSKKDPEYTLKTAETVFASILAGIMKTPSVMENLDDALRTAGIVKPPKANSGT